MKTIVWPEYDVWFRHARYNEFLFEKLGTSIKARDPKLAETWRIDTITWSEQTPAAISGLHNKGAAVAYVFEEGPGIPANIWKYATGAFTETETIKLFMSFGNSDDPESKFEQNMKNPLWNSRRIDTRSLSHIDKNQINNWLMDCGGDEDHDDFRVRVRGLPRKTAKDSIINLETVIEAFDRLKDFSFSHVQDLPVILACDPGWTGDDTCIWYSQGHYSCMLEKFKIDKMAGDDHYITYNKLVGWEKELGADAVFIDQGEGTGIYTLANNAGKFWELISFSHRPNDAPEFKDSEYSNLRAQMYYEANKYLMKGAVLDAKDPDWIEEIKKQLCWTKGTHHKTHGKKLAEPKKDIKDRVGQSPDVADGFVLLRARQVLERLPENDRHVDDSELRAGQNPIRMPDHPVDYEMDYDELYN
jgi:hypothetical protein